jgi:hypothetical protein
MFHTDLRGIFSMILPMYEFLPFRKMKLLAASNGVSSPGFFLNAASSGVSNL